MSGINWVHNSWVDGLGSLTKELWVAEKQDSIWGFKGVILHYAETKEMIGSRWYSQSEIIAEFTKVFFKGLAVVAISTVLLLFTAVVMVGIWLFAAISKVAIFIAGFFGYVDASDKKKEIEAAVTAKCFLLTKAIEKLTKEKSDLEERLRLMDSDLGRAAKRFSEAFSQKEGDLRAAVMERDVLRESFAKKEAELVAEKEIFRSFVDQYNESIAKRDELARENVQLKAELVTKTQDQPVSKLRRASGFWSKSPATS